MTEPLCGKCNIPLDVSRDGTQNHGRKCYNCFWEEEGGLELILPDYRNNVKRNKKEKTKNKPTDKKTIMKRHLENRDKLIQMYYYKGRPIFNSKYDNKHVFFTGEKRKGCYL